jgi:FKBP-type peptidyl-prolyl cis-trans isomerase SlyD
MQITSNTVVSIEYVLTNAEGDVIDRSSADAPLAYLHGAGNLIPGLEQALEGRAAGESLQVEVEPAQAYGEHDSDLVQVVPRDLFEDPERLEPGMRFEASGDHGKMVVTVTEVSDNGVTIDGNHPLAGQTLSFDVTVAAVRAATDEEVAHGHVHA